MALSRKHRPQIFDSVIGQEHIIKTITNQVVSNKVAHAYLFIGPRGIGKTTTARILAKALNCENRSESKFEPCNKCRTCEDISASQSIDVIEIDAASHTGVDNVRQNIIENSQFKPTKSKFKIFIIDEVHMLSTSAFNALLKTLEEPPAYIIFILATTDPHKLPDTIVSRCQRFNFKKISAKEMKKYLEAIADEEKIKIDGEVLNKIIKKSEGSARDSITLFEQISATGEKHITLENTQFIFPTTKVETQMEFINFLADSNAKKALELVNELAEKGVNLSQFSADLVEFLRYLLINKIDATISNSEMELIDIDKKEMQSLAEKFTEIEIVKLIDLTIKRGQEIKTSPLPQLPLEMLTIEWIDIKNNQNISTTSNSKHETNSNKKESVLEKQKMTEQKIEIKTEETETTWDKMKKMVKKDEKEINLSDVENNWSKLLQKLETTSQSLVFILKMAEIVKVENNTIYLSTKYSFHQEKISERKNRQCLENLFDEILQTKTRIEITVSEETKIEKKQEELTKLASVFGGEIVN